MERLGNGLIPGGKEKDKARQAVTPTNPFGNDPEGEEPHDDHTVPQKIFYVTRWKHDQNVLFWTRVPDKVIRDDDLRYDTWRLHGSCDLSRRRSSNFRKA